MRHKNPFSKRLIPLFIMVSFILSTQSTFAAENLDNSNKIDPLGSQKLFNGVDVGEFTGAAMYDYPIKLPAGRNGMTPSLSLNYNSQDESPDSMMGFRWSMTDYSIKRLNKTGVEKMYDANNFIASTPFESGELRSESLTDETHGAYGQRFESSFANYEFSDQDVWTVTAKNGTIYTFGATSASQVFDPNDPSRIFEWKLSEVRDLNNNYISYSYGRIDNKLYPEEITYAGHGNEDGIFRVEIQRSNTQRPDNHFSYATGFRIDSNYLITGVDVYADNQLRYEYEITHAGVQEFLRQTVTGILETGYSSTGEVTTLPETTFEYSESSIGWEETDDYVPNWVFERCDYTFGCNPIKNYAWDMTKDGLVDFEVGLGGIGTNGRYVNDGMGGWIYSPAIFNYYQNTPEIPGIQVRPTDFNGDTLMDVVDSIRTYSGYPSYIYGIDTKIKLGDDWSEIINDTIDIGFWDQQTSINRPSNGASIADLNGDGLPDVIQGRSSNFFDIRETCLNENGDACVLTDLWITPEIFIQDTASYQTAREAYVQDCNYDGLADVHYRGSGWGSWINDGNGGWVLDPEGICNFTMFDLKGNYSIDLNGDGLIDRLHAERVPGNNGPIFYNDLYVNNGGSYLDEENPETGLFPPELMLGMRDAFNNESSRGVKLVDVDGDKLPDIIQSSVQNYQNGDYNVIQRAWLNTGSRPYFLETINTSSGSEINLEYKTSAQYRREDDSQANPDLSIIVDTISRMTVDDGLGNISSTDYFYEDGNYYFDNTNDKSFAGFGTVTKTDQDGYETKTYYHQGQYSIDQSDLGEFEDHISKKGRSFRTELYDNSGNLYKASIQRWNMNEVGDDQYFPYLERSIEKLYTPSTGAIKTTAESFTYDAYGNVIKHVDHGEVMANTEDGTFFDIGDDELTTEISIVENVGNYVVSLPYEVMRSNQDGAIIGHERIYYDGLALGSVTNGNVTRSESLVSGGDWIGTETDYNVYGLIVASRDALGNEATTSYDAFNLYPTTATNALGQAVNMVFDPAIGQMLSITDANGATAETSYDGLGRIISSRKTDSNDIVSLLNVSEIIYNDNVMPRERQTIVYRGNNGIEKNAYFDGLGRLVSTSDEAEGANYANASLTYDARGNLENQELPAFNNDYNPNTQFTYDAIGRVLTATNDLGVTTMAYDDWEVSTTDPNGVQKDLIYDVRGNLIQVREYLAGVPYFTNYEYDSNKNLTRITDAEGNVKNMTYDLLGRKLSEELFHSPAEVDPGNYTFVYDDNNNLISRIDLKAQEISYTYDELNRVLVEMFGEERNVKYTYDEDLYSVGKLSSLAGSNFTKNFQYDILGRVIREKRIIEGQKYNTIFKFDNLDSLTRIVYPDGFILNYTYNNAGQMESVVDFVSDLDYNAVGSVIGIEYANGVTTTNTYDPNQFYQLDNKLTIGGGGMVLQDINYTFDALGNVTGLQELADIETARSTSYIYDDLNRLTSATAINTGNFEDYNRTYAYDIIGNITNKSDIGDYNYDSFNPHAVTSTDASIYTYDANGNLATSGSMSHTYDQKNRLISSSDGESSLAYTYDEAGTRLTKLSKEDSRIYVNNYFELDGEDVLKFIYAGGTKVATIDDLQGTTYAHSDHLSSSSIETDQNGGVIQMLDYFPYGSTRLNEREEVYDTNYKFTGKEQDSFTNLYYYEARYYDPLTGRFTSVDPWFGDINDPQTFNKYAYVRNNPLKYVDPTGETLEEAIAGYANGVVNTLSSQASGIANAARNPVRAVISSVASYGRGVAAGVDAGKQLASSFAANPQQAISDLARGISLEISDFMSLSDYDKGAAAGNAVVVGTEALVGARAASALKKGPSNFFDDASYTRKVTEQMNNSSDSFHSFSKSVDAYAEKFGKVENRVGGDGKNYQILKLDGATNGKNGTFEYIKDSSNNINHRKFEPDNSN